MKPLHIEIWKEISNFIPLFVMDVITYPCMFLIGVNVPFYKNRERHDFSDWPVYITASENNIKQS